LYYGNPYVLHWPTPDKLKPPPFIVRPANVPDRKTPAVSVTVPPLAYDGVRPLTIDNPYYRAASKLNQ
jgi:hypothetical protein